MQYLSALLWYRYWQNKKERYTCLFDSHLYFFEKTLDSMSFLFDSSVDDCGKHYWYKYHDRRNDSLIYRSFFSCHSWSIVCICFIICDGTVWLSTHYCVIYRLGNSFGSDNDRRFCCAHHHHKTAMMIKTKPMGLSDWMITRYFWMTNRDFFVTNPLSIYRWNYRDTIIIKCTKSKYRKPGMISRDNWD